MASAWRFKPPVESQAVAVRDKRIRPSTCVSVSCGTAVHEDSRAGDVLTPVPAAGGKGKLDCDVAARASTASVATTDCVAAVEVNTTFEVVVGEEEFNETLGDLKRGTSTDSCSSHASLPL